MFHSLKVASIELRPAKAWVYLGHFGVDMQPVNAAAMFAVGALLGALWGFRTNRELLDNGPQALVEHPMEALSPLGHNTL